MMFFAWSALAAFIFAAGWYRTTGDWVFFALSMAGMIFTAGKIFVAKNLDEKLHENDPLWTDEDDAEAERRSDARIEAIEKHFDDLFADDDEDAPEEQLLKKGG